MITCPATSEHFTPSSVLRSWEYWNAALNKLYEDWRKNGCGKPVKAPNYYNATHKGGRNADTDTANAS